MIKGKVSVIMPCYNSAKTIISSIHSILNQSYKNFELIIIDDGSTDNSIDVINSLYDTRIHLIENKSNIGVAKSRNKGICFSQSEFIAFCDSDDLWESNKLELQIEKLEDYDIVCSNYQIIDENELHIKTVTKVQIFGYNQMLRENLIPNSSGIYNAGKIGKVYQKDIGNEDYLMWLQLISKSKTPVYRIDQNLMKYRRLSTSLSSNKLKSAKWTLNIYLNELKLGYLKTIYYFSMYVIQGIRKHY